jgi:hypothetical protein
MYNANRVVTFLYFQGVVHHMAEFSKAELEAAQKAITSSIRKLEKAQTTLSNKQAPPKSQLTLATRNLDALRLALALITRELKSDD